MNSNCNIQNNDVPQGDIEEAVAGPPIPGEPSASSLSFDEHEERFSGISDDFKRPIEKSEDPFKCLGHNCGVFYFLTKAGGQILQLANQTGIKANPLMLAPEGWWAQKYPALVLKNDAWIPSGKPSWTQAIDATIQECYEAGVFKSDLRIRGAGVWLEEDGAIVINCGNHLIFRNTECDSYNFKSFYIYSAAEQVYQYADRALTDDEAVLFLNLIQKASWKKDLPAGKLAAGWAVMAMICGYLKWRPHIWVTGAKGSGKSWIINQVMTRILYLSAINIVSGTTEAGLRQQMGIDSRPVLLDEAESVTLKDSDILQAILMSIRRSSSGAVMAKGSQNGKATTYQMTSSYCLGSIYHSLSDPADLSRISVLEMDVDSRPRSFFNSLKKEVEELLTPEYARRMLRRMVDNIEVVNKNISIFQDALSESGYEPRAADQISALLTGVRMLQSTNAISIDNARNWVKAFDFKKYTNTNDIKGAEDIVDVFLTRLIKVYDEKKNTHREMQLHKVIRTALGMEIHGDGTPKDIHSDHADRALRNIDIKVENEGVYFRKPSEHLKSLFKNTRASKEWNKVLLDITGAVEMKSKRVTGNASAAIFIPRDFFDEDKKDGTDKQPSLDEYEPIGVF